MQIMDSVRGKEWCWVLVNNAQREGLGDVVVVTVGDGENACDALYALRNTFVDAKFETRIIQDSCSE